MPNMSLKKTEMPMQDEKRIYNIQEVTLGYTMEMAVQEADRCLHCKNAPCMQGCPVGVRIPDFIAKIKENNLEEAYHILKQTSALPAVCGRVCPQESQCEKHCVRAIKGESVAIGRLERFAADWANEHLTEKSTLPKKNGHKVGIIGAGPAGLTCAMDLAMLGYKVDVFEALHVAGGVLVYGIPEFRLPKSIVQKEIAGLKEMGVNIWTNTVIGKSETIDELFEEGYEALFIASGAGLPNFMGLEGENLKGVYSANEFLTRFNLMKAYEENASTPIFKGKHVVVVGGGNVAMDAARCAKRLTQGDVTIVYRRSMEELPARKEEVEHAMEEGINFCLLTNPVKIHGQEGGVKQIECVKMQLGEADESGRRRPEVIPESNFILEADCVIMAIGTSPNPLLAQTTEGLEVNRRGCLVIDENCMTSREGVFAGGDAVSGAATVILAMGAGKKAAAAMHAYIQGK